jgi:hypothetical protein
MLGQKAGIDVQRFGKRRRDGGHHTVPVHSDSSSELFQ